MKGSNGAERPRGASDLFGSVDFPLKRHVSPHGQVTAVSMMKDEGPYVIEWVAHHLAVGFSDLVVYTNDCSDGTDDLLHRLEALGLAHHRRNVIAPGLRPQPSALGHANVEPVVQQSDWVMVFDADEFLSIRYGDGTLDDLLVATKARGANGIVVTWRIFGSGGVVDWSRAPVTEQYLMAAPENWNKGWGVKTLFTFDADYWKLGIHRPKMKNRHIDTGFPDSVVWLNGSGQPMEDYFKFRGWRSITRTVGHDWVQLNHYAVKSVDSYAVRKLRGNVNFKKDKYNADYWSLQDRNEVRDDTMLRYSARRNAIIAQLLADPVLRDLHDAALRRTEDRLAEMRATGAYKALVAELAEASQVPIGEIVAKPPRPRDRARIAAKMTDVEARRGTKARDDRKGVLRAAPHVLQSDVYRAAGGAVAGGGVAADWVRNHGVLMLADPAIFTPAAVQAIAAGKFERSLARRIPTVLPRGMRVLEIGSGCGFLAAHLRQVRADLHVTVQEDDPALHALLLRLSAANGLVLGEGLGLCVTPLGDDPVAGLGAMLAEVAPQVLILGDPRLSPATLDAHMTAVADVAQVYVVGRLLERWQEVLDDVDSEMHAHGFVVSDSFERDVARAYLRLPKAGE